MVYVACAHALHHGKVFNHAVVCVNVFICLQNDKNEERSSRVCQMFLGEPSDLMCCLSKISLMRRFGYTEEYKVQTEYRALLCMKSQYIKVSSDAELVYRARVAEELFSNYDFV